MTEPVSRPATKDRRPILNRPELGPEERQRIGRLIVVLLGWGLVATALLGFLVLWHLIRRGRILRSNLAPPRPVSLPDERPIIGD